jgi:integration host factor subunit beta
VQDTSPGRQKPGAAFFLTLPYGAFTVKHRFGQAAEWRLGREYYPVTKKEIVKQISDELDLTQLKVKDIVQKTFDAIVETLLRERRIELRNFGVFEVKRRKARKARNPRTGEPVEVEPKNVVTFKPGKEMEEKVRKMPLVAEEEDELEGDDVEENNGADKLAGTVATKAARARKMP